jgi:bla regulator protein BlaR1
MRNRSICGRVNASPVMWGAVLCMQIGIPAHGQILHADGQLPSFEVTTIKRVKAAGMESGFRSGGPEVPGSVNHTYNTTVRAFIEGAYNLPSSSDERVLGGPSWIDSNRYDIDGKIPENVLATIYTGSPTERTTEMQLMQQTLLADRFKLTVHFETRVMPVYALVLAKGGPKLTPAKPTPPPSDKPSPVVDAKHPPRPEDLRQGILILVKGGAIDMTVKGLPLDAWILGRAMRIEDRPLVNNTGLTGKYDFSLHWVSDQPAMPGQDGLAAPSETGPSFYTALQEQLGLRLLSTKAPVEVIVVDHIELPSEN